MPREVRRAALTPGCSLFGRVMTVSEPPKVNDVHNVSLSNEPSHKDVLPWDSKATLLQGKKQANLSLWLLRSDNHTNLW